MGTSIVNSNRQVIYSVNVELELASHNSVLSSEIATVSIYHSKDGAPSLHTFPLGCPRTFRYGLYKHMFGALKRNQHCLSSTGSNYKMASKTERMEMDNAGDDQKDVQNKTDKKGPEKDNGVVMLHRLVHFPDHTRRTTGS